MRKPLPDQIASLKTRRLQIAARLAALEGRAKREDRKRDTRRKIVVGAAVLSELERNPRLKSFVCDMLGKAVTRPQDREAIADLLPSPALPEPLSAGTADDTQGEERLAG